MRFNIDALGFTARAALTRVLSVAFDLFAATCLTSAPNPLSLVHRVERDSAFEGSWRRRSPSWSVGSNSVPAVSRKSYLPTEASARLGCGVESLSAAQAHSARVRYRWNYEIPSNDWPVLETLLSHMCFMNTSRAAASGVRAPNHILADVASSPYLYCTIA